MLREKPKLIENHKLSCEGKPYDLVSWWCSSTIQTIGQIMSSKCTQDLRENGKNQTKEQIKGVENHTKPRLSIALTTLTEI